MNSSARSYVYQHFTIEEQLKRLSEKGLEIDDYQKAEYYLKFVGYHRLSAYYIPFQPNPGEPFNVGSCFSQVVEVYEFDRALRLLVLDAIDRIEVALRSVLSITATDIHGPHWFLSSDVLKQSLDRRGKTCLNEIEAAVNKEKRNQDSPVSDYYSKYNDPYLPPSWVVFEILSFGNINVIYQNIKTSTRKQIALNFGVNHIVLESWIRSLSYLRNICAHHSRVWNRSFRSPRVLDVFRDDISEADSFLAQAFVIAQMLKPISIFSSRGSDDGEESYSLVWKKKLETLIRRYDSIEESEMGFPEDWQSLPIWK